MSVYVLVHGWWGGGWEWRAVAHALRAQGHEVYAPTLSGLGDRAHVPVDPAALTLGLHIEDVIQLTYFEDLRDVILVGWSYGADIVAGVADRVPERVRHVVNFDGGLVRDGQAAADESTTDPLLVDARANGWVAPPGNDDLAGSLADPELRAWVADRLRPQPVATEFTPFPDFGRRRDAIPHTYIRCTVRDIDDEPEPPNITALRSAANWRFRELPFNHLALTYAPQDVAALLHELG